MICCRCRYWFRECGSQNPAAVQWAADRGFTGPIAPQQAPDGPPCPGFTADRRAGSRTTTPCYTEKL